MNENIGNSGNDFFYDLLDNPAHLSHSNASNLQSLINKFPQSGLLRSMMAVKPDEENLKKASVYIDPKLLYKIAIAPGSLPSVSNEQIAFCEERGRADSAHSTGIIAPVDLVTDESNYFHVPIEADVAELENDVDVVPVEQSLQEGYNNGVIVSDGGSEEKNTGAEEALTTEETDEVKIQAEQADGDYAPEGTAQFDGTGDKQAIDKTASTGQEIDDEVFEEIVSIEDIGLEQLALIGKAPVADDVNAADVKQPVTSQEESVAGSYFVFEPTLPEDEAETTPANATAQLSAGKETGRNLSRYNDEKMPYSFMWWLDKTRKEHASIYQPFVTDGKFHTATIDPAQQPQSAADHLQQQYVENIFAVSSVISDLNVAEPKADAQVAETKEDKIIEKFIHEEPQIKHPSQVKLDNENKAKKSSEDRDELVTETLAKIYTEQMLYHKAVVTYKKLMLKFPEKSVYFAGQIEQLENKINK